MDNKQKLIEAFVAALGVSAAEAEGAVFKETRQWDSVGHVNLMAAIEEAFDISLDPDDIMDLKSFEQARNILAKYEKEV